MSSSTPVETVAVSNATSTSASSSLTASVLSESPQSFRKQGGTVKRNILGKNEVWEFFQIYNEKNFKTHAFCILCKSDVNYGITHSTSNLEKHMQRHHKKEYENIMCERANKRLKLREADNTSTGIQQKLTPFMESSLGAAYEECLLDWMIDSYQPLSAVQKDSFRKLTHCLNRKAPIIGQEKVRKLLSMKFFETQQDIIKILKGKNKLRDPLTGLFENPLDWWRVNETNFPYLAKLALKYLSIPATSAPSERVFSTAGLTIAKDRARLEASRANEIVFLHDSVPELRKYHALIDETVIEVN